MTDRILSLMQNNGAYYIFVGSIFPRHGPFRGWVDLLIGLFVYGGQVAKLFDRFFVTNFSSMFLFPVHLDQSVHRPDKEHQVNL